MGIKFKDIGNVTFEYVTNNDDNPHEVDTEVRIPEATLCWIPQEQIEMFHNDIKAIVNKYRI